MTGQGDKNFERIKNAKQSKTTLDVSRNYKTANGCAVRNLKAIRTNKAVIRGKVVDVAVSYFIITGEVNVKNKWLAADWNAEGKHPQEQYHLVEVKEQKMQQANLF